MNGQLGYRLTLDSNNFTSNLRGANSQLSSFRQNSQAAGASSKGSLGGLASMAKGAAVAAVAYKGLELAIQGARASYMQFAQSDRLERALAATMGSADAAKARLVQLRDVAKSPGLGLEEAAKGDIRLQAVEISATRSERILRSVGNALASAGAGKAELDGVIVVLSQMAAKGKVSAEEINQIAERMPQIRKAMKDAFGTADTEEFSKLGVSVEGFIDGIVGELEKLPKAAGGAANAMENLDDSWKNLKTSVGGGLAPFITPVIEGLGKAADDLAGALDGVSPAENARLSQEGAKFAREQAKAAEEKAAAEKEASLALSRANNEAERQVTMQKAAAEFAERRAAAEKEARAAAMQKGTTATRRIIELTTPAPELAAKDLEAAMAKARNMASLINGQARPRGAGFDARDLANAADEEKNLTKKAAMRALLAEIVGLQVRQRDLAKEAADDAARAAKDAADKAKSVAEEVAARKAASTNFEEEGRILAARAAGNAKLIEALEREQKVRQLTLDIVREQGVAEDQARKMAADRVALEERAAGGRPRRGLRNAEDSARSRFGRMSERDQAKRGGTFDGFLDRDPTTRNSLAYRARLANRAAEFGTPGRPDPKKEGDKLQTLAAKQQATLESIDARLADLGLAR